jgi:hypothetical protein
MLITKPRLMLLLEELWQNPMEMLQKLQLAENQISGVELKFVQDVTDL